jgi:starvation-inducible DNA-binding protein
METNIGINQENRNHVASAMAVMLADVFVLYTKTRNAHWNVEGPDFHSMHKFFEEQYEQLDEIIDDIAERMRSLGHYAPARLRDYQGLTRLSEETRDNNDSHGFIRELLVDHDSIIIHLRENINRFANEFHDLGTSDFITELMEVHEKMAWMLRAHLK